MRELGRFPETRSDTASVREYATFVFDEHGALFAQLARVLQHRGIPLPYSMSDEGARQGADLDHRAGDGFDRAYLAGQVSLQQLAAADIETLRGDADADLRRWARTAADAWQRDEAWARQTYGTILIGESP